MYGILPIVQDDATHVTQRYTNVVIFIKLLNTGYKLSLRSYDTIKQYDLRVRFVVRLLPSLSKSCFYTWPLRVLLATWPSDFPFKVPARGSTLCVRRCVSLICA